jgi:hypothetical protein
MMKDKEKNMGKNFLYPAVLALLALILASCPGPFDSFKNGAGAGMGTIRIGLSPFRSVVGADEKAVMRYEITLDGPASAHIVENINPGAPLDRSIDVNAGNWTVTVRAYNTDDVLEGDQHLRGFREEKVAIIAGETKQIDIKLITVTGIRTNEEFYEVMGNSNNYAEGSVANGDIIVLQNDIEFDDGSINFGYNSTFRITVAADGNRKMSLPSYGSFFSVGGATALTLGDVRIPGTLTLEGIESNGSPLISVNSPDSVLTMNAGVTITGNVGSSGGGISVQAGDFIMNGGSITHNFSNTKGGGVYFNGGTFIMRNDAAINYNTAVYNGGGVCVEGGEFIMEGGSISYNVENDTNYQYDGGGGVACYAKFIMKNGTISHNKGSAYGGGIFSEGGEFIMEGGTITDNNPMAVSMKGGTIFMEGGAVITPDNPVFLETGSTIILTGNLTGQGTAAKIVGEAAFALGDQIITSIDKDKDGSENDFLTADNCRRFVLDVGYVDADGRFDVDSATVNSWNELRSMIANSPAQTQKVFFLANDIDTGTDSNTIAIGPGQEIIIGGMSGGEKKITRGSNLTEAPLFTVGSTGSLRLGTTFGDMLILDGGNVSVDAPLVLVSGGTFSVADNATLKNNRNSGDGGAVYQSGGTFILAGGIISENTSAGNGGGVYVGADTEFEMNGGSIIENMADSFGGGVYINSGVFTMNSGDIGRDAGGGNQASEGGGVYITGTALQPGIFNMRGGTIAGNAALLYGSGVQVTDHAVFNLQGYSQTDGVNEVRLAEGKTINLTGNLQASSSWIIDYPGPLYTGLQLIGPENGQFVNRDNIWFELSPAIPGYEDYGIIGNGKLLNPNVSDFTDLKNKLALAKGCGSVHLYITGPITMTEGIIIGYDQTILLGGRNSAKIITRGEELLASPLFTVTGGTLYLTGNLTLNGGGVPAAAPLVKVTGGEFLIGSSSIILTNNRNSGNGGAVLVEGGKVSNNGGIIRGNSAYLGGGVYAAGGRFSITGSSGIISENTATKGGGIYIDTGGYFNPFKSEIAENEATIAGGGIYNIGTVWTVDQGPGDASLIIRDNRVTDSLGEGGGIWSNGTVTFNGGTIKTNSAATGKGVYVAGGTFGMRGNALVDADNDVYLKYLATNLARITITDSLSSSYNASNPAATITAGEAYIGAQVLAGTASLISSNRARFALNNAGYGIDSNGKLYDNRPALDGTVSISGTPIVGQTLTADTGSLGGSGTISYQWIRSDNPDGTSNKTNIGTDIPAYEIVNEDVDKYIILEVTRTANSGIVASGSTQKISLAILTGTVSLAGTPPIVGQTLTATVSGTNGIGSPTYHWTHGEGTTTSSSNNTYSPVLDDAGHAITLEVSYPQYYGSIVSAETLPVEYAPLARTVSITGTTTVGQTLTAVTTAITGGSGNYNFQWQSASTPDGTYTDISGATASTYALTVAEVGKFVKVKVICPENSSFVTSAATVSIADLPLLTGTINIYEFPNIGRTLSASISGFNGSGNYHFHWHHNTTPETQIGTDSQFYIIVEADLGKQIAVTVTRDGATGSVSSSPIEVTAAVPTIDTQPIAVRDYLKDASAALSVTASVPDSGTLSYQWYSNTDNSNTGGTSLGSDNNAQTATYTLPTNTVGGPIYYYVVVTNTKTNANGTKISTAASNVSKITILAEYPVFIVTVTITGTPAVGTNLFANISGPNGYGNFHFNWHYSIAPETQIGTDSQNYTIVEADLGNQIEVTVTRDEATGSVTSSPTGVIQ